MSGYVYQGGTYVNKKEGLEVHRGDRLTEDEVKALPKSLQQDCKESEAVTANQGVNALREQVASLQERVAAIEEERQSLAEENTILKAELGEVHDENVFPQKAGDGTWELSDGSEHKGSWAEAKSAESKLKKKE